MRICPFCSTENEAFFRFCLGCGADLDEALGSEDAPTPTPEPAPMTAGRPAKARVATREEAEENGPTTASIGLSRPSGPVPGDPIAAVMAERAAEFDVLPDVSGDATVPDGKLLIPKPRTSSKDTAVDMPAVTPEMLAQLKVAGGKEARSSRPVSTRHGASPPAQAEPLVIRPVAPAPTPAAGRAPTATPGSPPPRAPRDRDKTLEPGGAVKPGSAASQAVAQAQGDTRRPAGPTEQVGAGPAIAARAVPSPAARSGRASEAPPEEPVRTRPTPVASPGPTPSAASALAAAQPVASPDGSTRRSGSPDVAPPTAKRQAGAKPKARLVIILEDGTDGSILDLSPDTTVVGREGVDISFPHDDFLAKRHAEFAFVDGTLNLRPLESTNGVFLQVHQEVELENGDVFRIGQQLLSFEMLSMVASSLAVDPKGQAIPLGSPVPEGAWGRLGQLIAPETLGSVYLLGGNEVYLGRERGDITFPGDGFVSGLHAQISMRNGRCFLKDLGSSNGTYLRLSKATPVRRGMLVLAGQQLFRVES